MRRSAWFITACLLVAAATPLSASRADGADANTYTITGSTEALWVLRQHGPTYDVVAKPISKEWQWRARGLPGRPIKVVAADRRLIAFFANRSVLIHSLDTASPIAGASPSDPNWPKDAAPLALSATRGIGEQDGSVIAVVPISSTPRSPEASRKRTPTTAGGENLGSAEPEETRLAVFLQNESGWRYLSSLSLRRGRSDEPVYAASASRALYLWMPSSQPDRKELTWPEGGDPNGIPALVRFDGRSWHVELTRDELPAMKPAGMASVGSHIVLLGRASDEPNAVATTRPTTTRAATQPLLLLGLDLAGGTLTPQRVVPARGVDAPVNDPLLGVTRLGERVILAWPPPSAGKPLVLGNSGLDGTVQGTEPLTVLHEPEPSGDSAQVIEIMMGAVLVAMFIPLFILRPRGPQKPFGLPKGHRPGNLLKRLVAGVIDLSPFMAAASLAFGVEPQNIDELWEMTSVENYPVEYAYGLVSMLGCYVVYGVVMEYRYQATVGKLITRLRVVGNGGDKPDLRACFLRNIVKIVELVTFLLPLLIVLPIVTPYRQRLGDMLARTAIVEKDSMRSITDDTGMMSVPDSMRSEGSDDHTRREKDAESRSAGKEADE